MIRLRLCPSVRSLCGAPILFAAAMLAITPVRAERAPQPVSPFGAMVGTWSGNGTVSLTNGSSERIRCQAAYAIGDASNNLRSVLRCASDSYKFELASDVKDVGGAISGAWKEVSRNVTGPVAGTVRLGDLQASIDMPGFAASLNIKTQGDRQVVSLQSLGTELAGVSITLSRK
jgi:hypothetical protein